MNHSRWREWPGVAVSDDPPAEPGVRLMLVRLVCRDGEIAEIDSSERRPIGLEGD